MPFPKTLSATQKVGLLLIGASVILTIFFKDHTVRMSIYVLFGVGVPFALNDPMKQSSLKLQLLSGSLTLFGAAVFAAFLIYTDPIGHFLSPQLLPQPANKTITVFVQGKANNQVPALRSHGSVIMHINGAITPEPIDYKGEAKFSNLNYGDSFKLDIDDSEPYVPLKPDSVYEVGEINEVTFGIYLRGVNRVYGRVTYNNKPLPQTIVFIDSLSDTTDYLGRFSILIPEAMQRQKYEVTADKDGFLESKATAYPESQQSLPIIMRKK